ncbi:FkbM family methyltransferase [Undibacterium sp. GrIS 1.8]|uniref:FkbM family methyltransferase n=1 Tax=Undibacterium sp. GrIS 1.8 TaxID=3143934 RepID=UPI00339122A5
MTAITSYAQNFEDVMLWRALGHIQNGRYIDIGAQDPVVDSVSLAFHEHGWKGIHVEPTPRYAEVLRLQRPGDEIIQAAISTEPGVIRFFEILETGISTGDPVIAQQHRERGFDVREISVVSLTLNAIFNFNKEVEFHWLKIDVEGFEEQVLTSWAPSTVRPWVVVVESTLPLTQIDTHEDWERILLGYGYTSVYFDGLNRYYVSEAHPELQDSFLSPPNVFDGFSLNGTASNQFHQRIVSRHNEHINNLAAESNLRALADKSEIGRLNQTLSELNQEHASQKHALELSQIETINKLQTLRADHDRLNNERIIKLSQELCDLHIDLSAREKIRADRVENQKHELVSMLQSQVEREQEVAEQILTIQQQSYSVHQENLRSIERVHTDRDRLNEERIKSLSQTLHDLQGDYLQREQNRVSNEEAQKQEFVRLLQSQAQREQEFAEKILAMQQQAEFEKAALLQHHIDQSKVLRLELESCLSSQISREQEFAGQLQVVLQKAKQELAEQTQAHKEQVRAMQVEQRAREQEVAIHLEYIEQKVVEDRAVLVLDYNEKLQILQDNSDVREKISNQKFETIQNERVHFEQAMVDLERQLSIARQIELSLNEDVSQQSGLVALCVGEIEKMKQTFSWRFTAPLRWIRSSNSNFVAPASRSSSLVNVELVCKDFYIAKKLESIRSHNESEGNFKMPMSSQTSFKTNPDNIYHVCNFDRFYDSEFISAAYLAILKRSPDDEGGSYYLKRLRSGISKENILVQIMKSPEAKQNDIRIQGLKVYAIMNNILNIPFLGTLAAVLMFSLTVKSHMKNLRAFENYVYRINQSIGSHSKNKDEAN